MNRDMTFSQLLLVMLSNRRQSQLDFARATGVSQSTLSSIISGRRGCGQEVAERMATRLGLQGDQRERFLDAAARSVRRRYSTRLASGEAKVFELVEKFFRNNHIQTSECVNVVELPQNYGVTEGLIIMRDGSFYQLAIEFIESQELDEHNRRQRARRQNEARGQETLVQIAQQRVIDGEMDRIRRSNVTTTPSSASPAPSTETP